MTGARPDQAARPAPMHVRATSCRAATPRATNWPCIACRMRTRSRRVPAACTAAHSAARRAPPPPKPPTPRTRPPAPPARLLMTLLLLAGWGRAAGAGPPPVLPAAPHRSLWLLAAVCHAESPPPPPHDHTPNAQGAPGALVQRALGGLKRCGRIACSMRAAARASLAPPDNSVSTPRAACCASHESHVVCAAAARHSAAPGVCVCGVRGERALAAAPGASARQRAGCCARRPGSRRQTGRQHTCTGGAPASTANLRPPSKPGRQSGSSPRVRESVCTHAKGGSGDALRVGAQRARTRTDRRASRARTPPPPMPRRQGRANVSAPRAAPPVNNKAASGPSQGHPSVRRAGRQACVKRGTSRSAARSIGRQRAARRRHSLLLARRAAGAAAAPPRAQQCSQSQAQIQPSKQSEPNTAVHCAAARAHTRHRGVGGRNVRRPATRDGLAHERTIIIHARAGGANQRGSPVRVRRQAAAQHPGHPCPGSRHMRQAVHSLTLTRARPHPALNWAAGQPPAVIAYF